jgi:hypothetical protein
MLRVFSWVLFACAICFACGCEKTSQSGAVIDDNSPVIGNVQLEIEFNSERENIKIEVPCTSDSTVFTVLELAQKNGELKFESNGRGADMRFVTSIGGVDNLAAAGDNWVYRVNGKLGDKSSGLYSVKPGDDVLWVFGEYLEKDN